MTAGLTLAQAQAAVGGFNNALAVGNIVIASAIVAAAAAGVTNTTIAGQIGFSITAADANPAATTTDRQNAAVAGGATTFQAQVAVGAYEAAKAAAGGGASAQVTAAAQTVAFVYAQPDIIANKQNSPFIIALDTTIGAGTVAQITPFFQKFLVNADQWDGYEKERKDLMNFVIDQGIQNVVATTGDIHAFFAGKVYNDFAGEVTTFAVDTSGNATEVSAAAAGTAAIVDLVTAGVSSTSFFEFVKAAVDALDPSHALIGNLVYYPVPISAPADAFYSGSPAVSFTANLNLLDYSLGKSAPATASDLAAQLNRQIKLGLAAAGVVEPALDASALGVQAGVAADTTFQTQALGLAQALSALGQGTNPWLAHVDTEAQGYAVVTASTVNLQCVFNKVNPQVAAAAPSAPRIVAATKTAVITAGAGPASLSVT
jgi:alkaline phosphatase D